MSSDLAWARDLLAQATHSIEPDLMPTEANLCDWLARGGRTCVVRGVSEAIGVSSIRRKRLAETGGAS